MPINVVCPGCRKRFQVSEQFAGRTGPCPSCKTQIQIPTAAQEVKVHTPEEFGGGGKSATTGKLILKPIAREEVQFSGTKAAIIAGSALGVAVVAFLANRLGLLAGDAFLPTALKALGLLLVSPPLVIGGYSILRDDELEPYRGRELYVRAGAIALAYFLLWVTFDRVAPQVVQEGELHTWLLVLPPFIVVGALAGLALDLEFSSGLLLYSFYLIATVFLRAIAGLGWVWNLASQSM